MNEPAITFRGVEKRYGDHAVLRQVDLSVIRGEFVGMVGENGAGKTTLLKCLLDFTGLSGGTIEIFGCPHTRTGARREVAYLPEKFTPPYYLSGRDFLSYVGRLHGSDPAPALETELLAALDLDAAALQKPVRQLSKGMSQKLGLLGCLMSGKELLVLDEPMSGLDPAVRARLTAYLAGLRAGGRTLFFSTHMLRDIEALCDRVAIMHAGRLLYAGTSAECCGQYGADGLEQAYLRCIESAQASVPGRAQETA